MIDITESLSESRADSAKSADVKPARRGYRLEGKTLVAYLLNVGETILLGHPRCPENRLLVQGQHFNFTPPHRGRDAYSQHDGVRDAMYCAKFTALVPLLLSVHEPWTTGIIRGCRTIGHFRIARASNESYGICRELMEQNLEVLETEGRLALGCKDAQYAEHLVMGGPLGAVLYHNEVAIPGYRWRPEMGTDNLPFTFIVDRQQLDLVRHSFSRGAAALWAAREGRKTQASYAVSGVMQTKQIGPITVQFDRVGRVHALHEKKTNGAVIPVLHKTLENKRRDMKFTLRVGSLVIEPIARMLLGLDQAKIEIGAIQVPAEVEARVSASVEAPSAPITPAPTIKDILPPLEDGWEIFVEGVLTQETGVELPRILAVDGQVIVPRGSIMDLGFARRIVSAYAADDIRLTPEAAPLLERINTLYEAWSTEAEEVEETNVEAVTEVMPEIVVEASAIVEVAAPAATTEAPAVWSTPGQPQRKCFSALPEVVRAAMLEATGLSTDDQIWLEMAIGRMETKPLPRIMTRSGALLVEETANPNLFDLATVITALGEDDVEVDPGMTDWFIELNTVYMELHPENNSGKRVCLLED